MARFPNFKLTKIAAAIRFGFTCQAIERMATPLHALS